MEDTQREEVQQGGTGARSSEAGRVRVLLYKAASHQHSPISGLSVLILCLLAADSAVSESCSCLVSDLMGADDPTSERRRIPGTVLLQELSWPDASNAYVVAVPGASAALSCHLAGVLCSAADAWWCRRAASIPEGSEGL